jgi:hypothetical protein
MSKIKKGKYKTIHMPYDFKKDNEPDNSDSINKSVQIMSHTNYDWSLANILFCFCLTGPFTLSYDEENIMRSTHESINWISEKKLTKIEFVRQKHHFSYLSNYIIRLVIFLILFCLLIYFEQFVDFFCFSLGVSLKHRRFVLAFFLSTLLVIGTILYTKISPRTKHLLNMFLASSIAILFLFYIIMQTIKFGANKTVGAFEYVATDDNLVDLKKDN